LKPQTVRALKYRSKSHPAGVRGLKQAMLLDNFQMTESHPAGVRGLKQRKTRMADHVRRRTPQGCVD